MPECFRLTPINRDHESWDRSRVKSNVQWIKIIAYDCGDARYKATRITDVMEIPMEPITQKYDPLIPIPSPWALDYVTSCEVDDSEGENPGDGVLTSDGERFPNR
jgi:hypothetical protein